MPANDKQARQRDDNTQSCSEAETAQRAASQNLVVADARLFAFVIYAASSRALHGAADEAWRTSRIPYLELGIAPAEGSTSCFSDVEFLWLGCGGRIGADRNRSSRASSSRVRLASEWQRFTEFFTSHERPLKTSSPKARRRLGIALWWSMVRRVRVGWPWSGSYATYAKRLLYAFYSAVRYSRLLWT